MIDVHSHILPCMDDGSRSLSESLAMLETMRAQGVTAAAATPHFYPDRTTPDAFLARRDEALAALRTALPENAPAVLRGAEVYYYAGICRMERLAEFCLGESRVLLLEMPFERWTVSMLDEVIRLGDRDVLVLLAHIERYFPWQDKSVWPLLRREGVLFQVNASFFLGREKRRALRMLRAGDIDAVGSDAHNTAERPPRLGEAAAVIEKRLGSAAWRSVNDRMQRLIGYEELSRSGIGTA